MSPTKHAAATGGPAAALPAVSEAALDRLLAGEHHDPHSVLGAHVARLDGVDGLVVRALHPTATQVECLLGDGRRLPMTRQRGALFALFLPGATHALHYRLRFEFPGGTVIERDDPYRFLPTLGELDLHLFNEGTHRRIWEKLGAHPRTVDGVSGVAFAVWAPNAKRVSLVGDFNGWDGRVFPMRLVGNSGVFELFVPGLGAGDLYKFELLPNVPGEPLRLKTDPFAFAMQHPPETASVVVQPDGYAWGDAEWIAAAERRDYPREPLLIYEMHLGSWARVPEEGNRWLTYRELAPRLVSHLKRFGFTHVELMPVMEHPFTGSWGYQVSGYYAPTARFGSPDDFRFFVDTLHRAGIGVLLDWVPAHFPRDTFALARFDGTALYEHEDPRLGEHPDWGTLIFNYGRNEVRNFLVANALYWMEAFHVDGLRVDAVASMLYLDYSRNAGEWMRNKYGGRENLEAIEFFRVLADSVRDEHPGCLLIAEESTAWPGVTQPVSRGGLGFAFKWNMGWMHDTLQYFAKDPLYRQHHQDQLTFAMVYEYSERFINAISHDEVVHLKRSLYEKMPGDAWQKFANLRLLLTYQYTRPGKKLLFMGTELAPYDEWHHDRSLDWHLADDPRRQQWMLFLEELGTLYHRHPSLWHRDHDPEGFAWIDAADHAASVLSYVRRTAGEHLVVVLNMTPVPRGNYRIGAPDAGTYECLFSSDAVRFGGSAVPIPAAVATEPIPFHGYPQSISLTLPPLGALILSRR